MADDVKRLNYFNGQFLRAPDFNDEQVYHIRHQRDHARLLHTPGIAEGLDIPVPAAGATAVTINAGVAYDDQGRRIVLADNRSLELADLPADQAVYVTIAYAEAQTYPTDETGITGNTRWTEAPLIETSAAAPANPNEKLVLAKIARSGTVISGIDRSERRSAGVKGGDLSVRTLTLTSESIAPSGWVQTELGASGRADVGGSLRVTGNLVVDGTIQGDIAVGTVQPDDLVDNAVTSAKLAEADGASGQNTNTGSGVKTGHIQDGAVTNAKLSNNSVDATKIVDGSVGTVELANGAVTNAKLAANSVDAGKIADGSINTNKLADAAVINAKLADNSVNAAKIIDGSVGTAELANAAVTNAKIADGAVSGPKIADNAIGEIKFDAATRSKLDSALSTNGGTVQGSTNFYPYQNSTIPEIPPNTRSHVGIGWYAGNDATTGLRKEVVLGVWAQQNPTGATFDGIFVYHYGGNTNYGLRINSGKAYFAGGKEGFVTDRFINASGSTLQAGDIVKLKDTGSVRFHGDMNSIPICEVTLADKDDDPLVIGIVDTEALPLFASPDTRDKPEDPFSIPHGGELMVVTLGAYARCKVDASQAPISVGDLLTTSANRGHAKKAMQPKIGSIIGKALEPLDSGTGYIAVFVNIQ